MNRSFRKAGYIFCAFLLFTAGISGCKKTDPPPQAIVPAAPAAPASLHVPFIPQIGDEWCWAACTEMVSTYYHDKINPQAPVIRQCEIVNLTSVNKMDCPGTPGKIPTYWDQPGTPFPPLGDTSCKGYKTISTTITSPAGAPLSREELISQIAAGLPVIFEWNWGGLTVDSSKQSGSHFMVAEGIPHSSYIDNVWISVHDPLPTGRGRHRIISYYEYENKKPMTLPGVPPEFIFCGHGSDYHQLTYSK